jgi:hypothetical protein
MASSRKFAVGGCSCARLYFPIIIHMA